MEPTNLNLSAVGGFVALAPELLPANAGEQIAAAMAANRRPTRRAIPQALGSFDCVSVGAGMAYDAGPLRIICIYGALNLNESPLDWIFGGVGSLALAKEIRDAADSTCAAIVFDVNCPGGSVAGMADIEAAVRYAKAKKPIHAIAHDVCASGGYYSVALSNEIVCTPSAIVGSIGAMLGPIIDPTKAMESQGISAFVARTGEKKGAGMLGVPLTDTIKSDLQQTVNTLAAPFFAAVCEGRRLSIEHVRGLQAGAYAGPDAVTAGLADRVVPSFTQYVAELQVKYAKAPAAGLNVGASARSKPAAVMESRMAINWSEVSDDDLKAMPPEVANKVKAAFPDKKEDPPATCAQLKEAFPNSDAFRLKALEAGMSMAQAQAAFVTDQASALAAAQAEVASLRAAAQNKNDTIVKVAGTLSANGIAVNGVSPVGESPTELNANAYEAAIAAEMRTSNVDRFKATAIVNQKQPALRMAWLQSQVATSGKRTK